MIQTLRGVSDSVTNTQINNQSFICQTQEHSYRSLWLCVCVWTNFWLKLLLGGYFIWSLHVQGTEGSDLVFRVQVLVGGWGMHHVSECPHKYRGISVSSEAEWKRLVGHVGEDVDMIAAASDRQHLHRQRTQFGLQSRSGLSGTRPPAPGTRNEDASPGGSLETECPKPVATPCESENNKDWSQICSECH